MAYGKKNQVNLNPLSYNIMLLGLAKIGKSSLIKEVCEKLVGDKGYLFLETGTERGADAIEGINHINTPDWDSDYDEDTNSIGFINVCEDIIENKAKEYPNLKTVIIDTYDHLIDIAERQVLKEYNKECRENNTKQAKSINSAYGGFGRGEKRAIELMLETFERLKKVGVSTIIIGHVKTKDITDPITDETYQILTSDQQQNYFNAVKKNMHFIGMLYIDRQITRKKIGRKDKFGNEIEKGIVTGESRKIKFRDDSYVIDTGSRFANIVPEIEFSADAFIKAMKDAILAEQAKGGRDIKEVEKEQKKAEKEQEERVKKAEEKKHTHDKELKDTKNAIIEYCKKYRDDSSFLNSVMNKCKDFGYSNPTEVDNLDKAVEILELAMSLVTNK